MQPKKQVGELSLSVIHDAFAQTLRLTSPEAGHALAIAGLAAGVGPRVNAAKYPRLRTALAGLDLPNPVGLAAGFDKDAVVVDALLAAGFGWIECGTVTPCAQPGQSKPRLFRLDEDQSIINRMGFNNLGMQAFAKRLARRGAGRGIVGANLGANKETIDQASDYITLLAGLWSCSSYLVINVSSPNTPRLRDLQQRSALYDLMAQVGELRGSLTAKLGHRPLFLKTAPDLDERSVQDIAEIALTFSVDALIVSNSTPERPASLRSRYAGEEGGLSGRALFKSSTETLRSFAAILGGRVALVGTGGVESAATALAKIKAGATAVQLYSSLVFQGPGLVPRILRDLDQMLDSEGFASIADAVGVE